MNYDNQPFENESIARELQAMREPVESERGLDKAVRAMQATPNAPKSKLNPWVLRLGSVGAAGLAIAAGISLTTPKAYASELKNIANQVQKYPRKYMKAYLFQGEAKPHMVTELWTDHNQEKFLQYLDGNLQVSTVGDGSLTYKYFSAMSGIPANALKDADVSEHFTVDTIESMLTSDFFKKRKILKQSGVMLNGKAYDYYDFANGYYRMWVDPVTMLPAQREIWNKGKELWERDVYEYPSTFPANTFDPPQIPGVPYYDYPAVRAQLETELAAAGSTVKVGGVTVTLKAIVHDMQSVTAFFTSDGDQGKFNDERRMPMPNVRFYTGNLSDTEFTLAKPAGLKNERMFLNAGTSLKNMETIKLGVWKKDKFLGYAEFPFKNVIEVPFLGNLVRRPVSGGVAMTASAGTVKNSSKGQRTKAGK